MKRILLVAIAMLGTYYAVQLSGPGSQSDLPSAVSDNRSDAGSGQWRSGQQVEGAGIVSRILPDDNDGSRHQRFILRLRSGRTLLVAHNIDLAPRVSALRTGDTVAFYGEYEWNEQGGVIHWTHTDPQRRHPAGWIEHRGRRYQ